MVDKVGAQQYAASPASGDELWGHPKGVYFLAGTEAWERFSFYGMRALLVLYMVQELLLPGHVENVGGMGWFRPFMESIFGQLSDQAFASQLFGLYAGFVYFTPLIGGWLADKWLGARKTVILGILLMGAGHILMVWEYTFLLALLLLILGSGCLKGNIAAQVGHLYPAYDEARRSKGFTIFSTGINIGATVGPLICGLLAQVYGWHYGFGTAGAVMGIAALSYFMGLKHFAPDRQSTKEPLPPMTGSDWSMTGMVLLLLGIVTLWSFSYDQMFNVGLLWVSEHVDLAVGDFTVPVPWFSSEDALSSIMVVPLLIAIWGWQERRGSTPTDLHKIAVGSLIMAASAGALALGAMQASGGGQASPIFPAIAFFLSGFSFMYVWPTALSLVSRRAPKAINARLMAAAYLTSFFSNIGAGWLARFYEPWGPTAFWIMMAGFSVAAAMSVILFGGAITRRMDALDAAGVDHAAEPAVTPNI